MVIRKKNKNKSPVIDLTGKDGNAYALLGYAKTYSKQLDYDFDKHFGDYVILEQ